MTEKTNEQLLLMIYDQDNEEKALLQLIHNLRPMMIKIGRKHLSKIPIYDTDDYVQEGTILLWTLIQKKKYNGKGKLSSLFYTAFDRKCINLHRSYVLKNLVQIHETDDDLYYYGYHICRLVIDEYATEYRKKQSEWNKRWAEKTGRRKPAAERKSVMTPEERREKNRQRSREYHAAHRDQCNAARKKWYEEHREYALLYQKLYDQGVRIGKKGPSPKAR